MDVLREYLTQVQSSSQQNCVTISYVTESTSHSLKLRVFGMSTN